MASSESIYPGKSYLLDPNYNFIGYRVRAGDLGATTSIQTANQLKEVNGLLNQGMKVTEISIINPEVLEMIPRDQFKEINRLNKLTGAESTIHAPLLDPSGFTEQGWSEENREMVERQYEEVVKRSHDLNPNGNIPVTIHATNIPGSEMIPEQEKGKGPVLGRMIAVDRETGKFIPLEREERFYPGKAEKKIYTPQEELEIINDSYWDNQLSQLVYYKERGDELLSKHYMTIAGEDPNNYTPEQKAAAERVKNAMIYLKNTYQSVSSLYNQAYKYSDDNPDARAKLDQASKGFKTEFQKYEENPSNVGAFSSALQNLISSMREITNQETIKKYKPIEEFAREKASETLSQVAFNSYKEFGDKSPIISVENPPYSYALASGKDLKGLIEDTRGKFVSKLVSEGKSKKEAEAMAEKLIGVTWDTSHISMIRKQGFGKEQVVKETKEIAPFVKHVHFNDNFGSTHTDLPPGMGDLPMKDIMKELEKAEYKGKKIFEGGNFFQHFQKSPFPHTLEYSSSPLYQGGPYWNQLGGFGSYYMGHGPVNPQIHHTLYGSSFSNLPVELGGEIPGMQSRFSGAPNQ